MSVPRSLASLVLILSAPCLAADPVFEGKDGVVIMEAESSTSDRGEWVERTSVEGFQGTGHLEFTGNTPNLGPATSPQVYRFTVDRDGIYHFWIRAYKRLVGEDGVKARNDQCNDAYVRLEGDFEAAGGIPKEILESDTKLYIHGQSAVTWDFTDKLDYHHPETHEEQKIAPVYRLKAGETYTLTISGRSQRFNMDRLVFAHEEVGLEGANAHEAAESGRK